MYLGIKTVKPLMNYRLELTFDNSEVKIFDLSSYLETGLFSELKDYDLFKQVRISFDTIEWPNGADLDPEILYIESKEAVGHVV